MRWGGWRWLAVLVVVPVMAGCSASGGAGDPGNLASATNTPSPPVTSSPAAASVEDPARFAVQAVVHAREAGVDPQLVMAILYNESYKPHDPALERAWQKLYPDAALGVANMHRATFDETKRGRSFAGRDWQELPDDPGLAIQAEAWYLHDLAAQLLATRSSHYTTDELVALGYNAGPGNMRAVARGTPPGLQAQSYLDTLHANWAKAGDALGHA
jgi:soluble lytic murein transglycosylase-like protein